VNESILKEGISSDQAVAGLKHFGYNELPETRARSIWQIARGVFREPMFILLIICGSVYFLLGEFTEGILLLCWVFVIIFIAFYQNRKTEKALDALKQLSSPRALVIRDKVEVRIAGREVVPDDVLILHEGDRIPADAVVLDSHHLTIDESLLTGESLPVVKSEKSNDLIYMGTVVVNGRGYARVASTGTNTAFGKIGVSLRSIEQGKTRLQLEMTSLIRNLFLGGIVISAGVTAAFYFSRGNLLNSFLNGLSAAMALLPEEFPVVLTVFLAVGAWRLSKKNVLTRNPTAIETLGSATVLCSDKTGTITQNKMQIQALYTNSLMYERADFDNHQSDIRELIKVLFYASGSRSVDPMEKAIFNEFEKRELPPDEMIMVKEYPLERGSLVMTRVCESVNNQSVNAYCKGAPEAVFDLCGLSEAEVLDYTNIVQQLARRGYRVLAAAQHLDWRGQLPEKQNNFNFNIMGLVAFEDPIRQEVPQAINECNEAGIKVIIVTGDHPETARSIARQIGLKNDDRMVTGTELKTMDAAILETEIATACIFARTVPEQKLQIIRALKTKGEIVAMTGDGVNDAPALKAADIGVAMGMKGTDVAREAASLVLLDDNFASIVQAIRSGRRIYDNLQKAMSYIIAIHIPIIGLVLLPAFFSSLPVLLMPMHIVFMELIIDPVCSIAFESEQEEENIMSRPPRNASVPFFGWNKMIFSGLKGILLLVLVLIIYFSSISQGHGDGEVRAITFSALIVGNVILILHSLSETRNLFSVILEKNLAVLIIVIAAIIMLLLTISVPTLREVFGFDYPGYYHFLSSVIGAMAMLIILEVIKYVRQHIK
jgi:Ca2+-transporting ATPase